MKKATVLATAAFAAALAPAALAQINETCNAGWKQAVTLQQVGAKCKWLNAGNETRLKAAEASNQACTVAKASEAEKADVSGVHAVKMKKFVSESTADMPCNDQAKKYFDEGVAKLR